VGYPIQERLVRRARPVVGCGQQLLHEPEDLEERVERGVAVEIGRVVDREWASGLARQLDDGRGTDGPLDVAVQLDLGERIEDVGGMRRPR
jgi:hypothetical protein